MGGRWLRQGSQAQQGGENEQGYDGEETEGFLVLGQQSGKQAKEKAPQYPKMEGFPPLTEHLDRAQEKKRGQNRIQESTPNRLISMDFRIHSPEGGSEAGNPNGNLPGHGKILLEGPKMGQVTAVMFLERGENQWKERQI